MTEKTSHRLLTEILAAQKETNNLLRTLVDRTVKPPTETDQQALLAARSAPDWQKHGFESEEAFERWNQRRWEESQQK